MPACLRCGSEKVIPDVPLRDAYGDVGAFSRTASVQVEGAPGAWFFKDAAAGGLHADICGECGHVELRVDNFRELYAKHLKARGVL
ncbi:MAG TPA: hypothetical protein VF170_15155 [Planctomycetaceae bacterium]